MKRLVTAMLMCVAVLAVTTAPASATTPPTVDIGGNGPKIAFDTTALTVPQSTDCTNDFVVAFTFVNTTKQPVYVTLDGSSDGPPLQPNVQNAQCFQGFTSGTQFVFGLTNRQGTKTYVSTLTVTVT